MGEEDTVYMHVFGGSFSSKKSNPVTDAFTCPDGFSSVAGPDDLTVCLAEKIQPQSTAMPRFGGMFSCDNGNIATETGVKGCPTGYSVYVMTALDGDCLINVCLKFESFGDVRNFPVVVLPPFFDLEPVNRTTETNETAAAGGAEGRMRKQGKSGSTSSSLGKSQKIGIGLSVGAIVVGLVAATAVGITKVKKHRKRQQANKSNDSSNTELAVIST